MKQIKKFTILILAAALCLISAVGILFGNITAHAYDNSVKGNDADKYVNNNVIQIAQTKDGSNLFDEAELQKLCNALSDAMKGKGFSKEGASVASKEIIITLGGKDWLAVYLSTATTEHKGGNAPELGSAENEDIILTLWRAENDTDTSPKFAWNEYFNANYLEATNKDNYPPNVYSTSTIRSKVLNIGSDYWGLDGNNVTLTSGKQLGNSEYAAFTMSEVDNSITKYLTSPRYIEWQYNQNTKHDNKDLYSNTWNTSGYSNLINYSDWKDDLLWLPSTAETVSEENEELSGLWQLSVPQASGKYAAWLRSAYNNDTSAFGLKVDNSNRNIKVENDLVKTEECGIRPAMHLNLSKVDPDIKNKLGLSGHYCGGVNYDKELNGDSDLSSLADGNYYLSSDITLTNTLEINSTVQICLNGHKITSPCTAFNVVVDGSLSVCDCSKENLGAIEFAAGQADCSAVVIDGGAFTLKNGKIQKFNSCGVYLKNGSFNMNGGEISENSAGVNYEGGTLTFAGKVNITNNTENLKLSKAINIAAGFSADSRVGITLSGFEGAITSGAVANGVTKENFKEIFPTDESVKCKSFKEEVYFYAAHDLKWEKDENQHWQACIRCGYIDENTRGAHVWHWGSPEGNSGNRTRSATCTNHECAATKQETLTLQSISASGTLSATAYDKEYSGEISVTATFKGSVSNENVEIPIVSDYTVTYPWEGSGRDHFIVADTTLTIKYSEGGEEAQCTIAISVSPLAIKKPTFTQPSSVEYDGNAHTFAFTAAEHGDLLDLGTATVTDAGSGTLSASLKDKVNCVWEEGGTDQISKTYEITKKALTITLSDTDPTVTYGEVAPAFALIFDGLVEKDAGLKSKFTVNCEYAVGSGVGNYPITLSFTADDIKNYNPSPASGGELAKLEVTKRTLTVSLENPSEIFYGDKKPEFTLEFTGLIEKDEGLKSNFTVNCSYTQDKFCGAGDYDITLKLPSSDLLTNYNCSQADGEKLGTLKVKPADLTLSLNHDSEVYSGLEHEIFVEFTGLKFGEVLQKTDDYTIEVKPNDGSATLGGSGLPLSMGEYKITVTLKGDYSKNYNIENAELTYSVTVEGIKPPSGDTGKTFEYSGELQGISISNYDDSTMSYEITPADAGASFLDGFFGAVNVGTYTLKISLKDENDTQWQSTRSGDKQPKEFTITITPAELTFNLEPESSPYTGEEHSNIEVEFKGLKKDDKLTTADYTLKFEKDGEPQNPIEMGEYKVSVVLNNSVKNYKIKDDFSATYTITIGELAPPTGKNVSFTYNGEEHVLEVVNFLQDKMSYEISPADGAAFEGGKLTAINAGEYTLKITPAQPELYSFKGGVTEVRFTLTIDKAELKVSVDNLTVTYGDEFSFPLIFAGFVKDDKDLLSGEFSTFCEYNRYDDVGVGEYAIKINVPAQLDNYTIVPPEDGVLTVLKKNITVEIEADGGTYKDEITASAEPVGYVEGHKPLIKLTFSGNSYDGTYTGGETCPQVAGEYVARASVDGDNYLLTGTHTKAFEVLRRDLQVTATCEKKVYVNSDLPALSAKGMDGEVEVAGEIKWDDQKSGITLGERGFGWTFTPANKNYNTAKGYVTLEVVAPELLSISATFASSEKIYPDTELSALRPYLTVTASYSDGSSKIVNDYSISGILTEGESEINITYGDKTVTLKITVEKAAVTPEPPEDVTLESISAVFAQGDRKVYAADELNSLKEYLTVTAEYSDGKTEEVKDYELSGTLEVGESVITVTYGGKSATFTVTVSEAEQSPVQPENPENPDNPDSPENPDSPDYPDNPSNPDNPTSPSNPDNPADKGSFNPLWLLILLAVPAVLIPVIIVVVKRRKREDE